MLQRLFPALSLGRSPQLPQRRWRIRAPRQWLWALVGMLVGGAIPFVAWWYDLIPLWPAVLPMALVALLMLPPPLVLGVDERGVALIVPGWMQDQYLWIPKDRLAQLELRNGWLIAIGSTIQQQGDLNWLKAASQTGSSIPPFLNLSAQSGLTAFQIAAPIHLLDHLARDEIELWMYRQGK